MHISILIRSFALGNCVELPISCKINGNLGATLQLSLSLSTKLLVVKPKGRRYLCNRSRQYEFLSTGNFNSISEGETSGDSQNSENTQNFFIFLSFPNLLFGCK